MCSEGGCVGGEVKEDIALYTYLVLLYFMHTYSSLLQFGTLAGKFGDTRRSIRDIRPVNSGHSAVEYRELTGEYRELTGEYRELTGEYLELMDRSNMRSSLSVISMYFDL